MQLGSEHPKKSVNKGGESPIFIDYDQDGETSRRLDYFKICTI